MHLTMVDPCRSSHGTNTHRPRPNRGQCLGSSFDQSCFDLNASFGELLFGHLLADSVDEFAIGSELEVVEGVVDVLAPHFVGEVVERFDHVAVGVVDVGVMLSSILPVAS